MMLGVWCTPRHPAAWLQPGGGPVPRCGSGSEAGRESPRGTHGVAGRESPSGTHGEAGRESPRGTHGVADGDVLLGNRLSATVTG